MGGVEDELFICLVPDTSTADGWERQVVSLLCAPGASRFFLLSYFGSYLVHILVRNTILLIK